MPRVGVRVLCERVREASPLSLTSFSGFPMILEFDDGHIEDIP